MLAGFGLGGFGCRPIVVCFAFGEALFYSDVCLVLLLRMVLGSGCFVICLCVVVACCLVFGSLF